LYGWQFERFENAWCTWLSENSRFNWTEERLHDHVEAMLKVNLVAEIPAAKVNLCSCASQILNEYGTAFFNWMRKNFEAGHELKNFTKFNSAVVVFCPGISFKPGTAEKIEEFLAEKYKAYRKVSYQLWIVVNLLSKLKNTYPGATLHDCDDGSDQNPVRLGSTALGNFSIGRNLMI